MPEVWKPSVTVAAVIERDGAFLLVEEEANGRIVFNQPAGHWERGESLAEACAREALEETAHHFRPDELLGVYRWHFPDADVTFLRFAFCGEVTGHDQSETEHSIDDNLPLILRYMLKHVNIPLFKECSKPHLTGIYLPQS